MKLFPAPPDNKFLSLKAQIADTNKGRCWAPLCDCRKPPIRAHSVQNSRILGRLQESGVVSKIQSTIKNKETHLIFKEVGRNKATTFRGFCADHDAELFQLIDSGSMDPLSQKQKALLTWRAITHEMADKLAMGMNFQDQYKKAIDAGEASEDEPHFHGMEAVLWMKVLYEFFTYRLNNLDSFIMDKSELKNYRFKHYVIEGTGPVIAASSFFTFEPTEQAYLALNVYPWENNTHVLFGYSREHTRLAAPYVRNVLTKGKVDTRKISALIISKMHNFVIKPSIVNRWSGCKREAILQAFAKTVVSMELLPPSDELDLFSN